jgi:site-specific DNA recombinase
MSHLDPPLQPRNGAVLQVLAIVRVSKEDEDRDKTEDDGNQQKYKERSLADQEALLRDWLEKNYGKPYNLVVNRSTGSGECVDREESLQARADVKSGQYDLVLTEDLGRIFRRAHAFLFCEHCKDYDTRLIALNDHVDTGRVDWRFAACFAVFRHEAYNSDTAARIRRSLRNRFTQGGICQTFPYGYIKPERKHKDDPPVKDKDVTKDPDAEPIYDQWFRMLEDGASFTAVADWLTNQGVSTGPGCRSEKWTGRMVRGVTFNPILKGVRVRNDKVSKRINETGRHISVAAPPEERLERHCPHLAFIKPARYDRLIRKLRARGEIYRNGRQRSSSHLTKKWRAWPGHQIVCGVCGNLFYWGGHGQTDHMMCAGAREYQCWNGITFDGIDAGQKLCAACLVEIEALVDFDQAFLDKVRAKASALQSTADADIKKIDLALDKVRRKIAAANESILSEAKGSRTLAKSLVELEAEEDRLVEQQEMLSQRQQHQKLDIPSIDWIKEEARALIKNLPEKPEFCQRMWELVPYLKVFPYRLCDGGKVVLRAKVVLNLTSLVPETLQTEEVTTVLRRELTVDLFDPPQREKFREQVVAMRRAGIPEWKIAKELKITITATQRAMALQRLMDERGLTDPYIQVKEPPADYPKLSRHQHRRYHFKPLPGHPNW